MGTARGGREQAVSESDRDSGRKVFPR